MKSLLIIAAILLMPFAFTFCQTQNVYKIYAIEYGTEKSFTPVSDIAIGAKTADSVQFSYYIWYLNGDNGKKILVDVGMVIDTTKPNSSLKNYLRPDIALRKLNVKPDDITDIIITHPHYDHIGGLDLFPKAAVWIQKNDYAYFVGDAWQKDADNRGLDKDNVLKIVKANLDGRVRFVNGDSIEIMPGIRVFIGSKHTFESQHLLVNSKTDKVLLASDDSWFYYNLNHLLSIPLTFDQNAYIAQLRRMKTLVSDTTLIIPGHDALVMKRFQKIADGVVKIR